MQHQQPAAGVIIVGSANADLVVAVDRRPAAGETLTGGDLAVLPGGKGANQAAAAARAGARTAMIGCVGDDAHGVLLRDALASAGVDVTGVAATGTPTGTAIITVTPDGENAIVVSPGANREVTPERARNAAASIAAAGAVVLNHEIPIETVDEVARLAAEAGTRVVLNAAPAGAVAPATLGRCDPLVVNEHEAGQVLAAVTGDPAGAGAAGGDPAADRADYAGIARRLCAAGARSVVITLGSAGALVCVGADGDVETVPAHAVPVVDTTGAGDAFVGALAAELAGGSPPAAAARFATAMAALAVQGTGAQASYRDRAAVLAFLATAAR